MNMLTNVEYAGLQLSSVGIGTWAIGGPYWTEGDPTGWGGPLDDSDSMAGMKLAIDAGLTHVDTADVYGYGRSERLVSEVIAGRRSGVTVATKVGFAGATSPSVFSPANIRFQCEQSLRNLATDVIDIYYLHHCDFGPNDMYLSGAADELNNLKNDGMIRTIGLSGYSSDDLIRVSSVLQPDFIQSWASIEHPEFIRDEGPLARHMTEKGIRFVAMMPYGQGRLLGKYRADDPPSFEAGDNRQGNPEFGAPSLAGIEPRLAQLREHFGPHVRDLITASLGFILKHRVVASVVPGYRSSAQVADLLAALDREYTEDDHAFVESVFPYPPDHNHPWAE